MFNHQILTLISRDVSKVGFAVGRHFLEHRLEDGRLKTGQFIVGQLNFSIIAAVTVSCNKKKGNNICIIIL